MHGAGTSSEKTEKREGPNIYSDKSHNVGLTGQGQCTPSHITEFNLQPQHFTRPRNEHTNSEKASTLVLLQIQVVASVLLHHHLTFQFSILWEIVWIEWS